MVPSPGQMQIHRKTPSYRDRNDNKTAAATNKAIDVSKDAFQNLMNILTNQQG